MELTIMLCRLANQRKMLAYLFSAVVAAALRPAIPRMHLRFWPSANSVMSSMVFLVGFVRPAGGLHRGMEVEGNRTQTPSIRKSMVGKSIVLHHHLEWGVWVFAGRWGDQRDSNWTGRLKSSAQHNSTPPYMPLHHKPGAQHNSTPLLGKPEHCKETY